MKIKPEDLTKLTDTVLLTCYQLEKERPGLLRNHYSKVSSAGQVKDPVKFLMWDLVRYNGGITFICDELYGYMNDDHVDTALRSIFRKEVQPRYLSA